MSKNNVLAKITSLGLLFSIVLFMISIFTLFMLYDVRIWIIVTVFSMAIGLLTSYALPSTVGNGGYFLVAINIFMLALLIVFDMYDEAAYMYNGGNRFLLDGIGQFLYIIAIPALFLVCISLLIINSRKKFDRINRELGGWLSSVRYSQLTIKKRRIAHRKERSIIRRKGVLLSNDRIFALIIAAIVFLSGLSVGNVINRRVVPLDLESPSLHQRRSEAKYQQQEVTVHLGESVGELDLIGEGYLDVCVRGFGSALGKSGTDYAYKCVYRVNKVHGANGSFPDIMVHLEGWLLANGWRASSEDVEEILAEYDKEKDRGGNIINSLPELEYSKGGQYLNISYANPDPTNQDRSYPVQYQIDSTMQSIRTDTNGTTIYEDKKIVEPKTVIQKARDQAYKYVFMISSEEEYSKVDWQ